MATYGKVMPGSSWACTQPWPWWPRSPLHSQGRGECPYSCTELAQKKKMNQIFKMLTSEKLKLFYELNSLLCVEILKYVLVLLFSLLIYNEHNLTFS